ncbi:type I-E CRISPR-associated protein Cse2/CasB [Actinokineospora diospyrosa]|uniref:CRISPR system Cascade subunit CasB n=1 Tax=Actinokineospora diospyrosa TaxID=103728 RepID=A0ABT1IC98_9PSEU|nr:type I-E CRISPR-associated protein Cse2/CasB [Actinokineospora diospyrosa]MCP2270255.1 CRISPR system Cascade subunit CasB [Actinokineospora diospyrosa]
MPEPVAKRKEPETPEGRFIGILFGLHHGLNSSNRHEVARARRNLAALRHSLVEDRRALAYPVVFAKDMPSSPTEEKVWLLVGGLFALNPNATIGDRHPRTLGASMGALARQGNPGAVERRFTQLLGRDQHSLPHSLRQVLRQLGDHGVAVHYGQLLTDLRILLGPNPRGDAAGRVRLSWARDYHRPLPHLDATNTDEPETTA